MYNDIASLQSFYASELGGEVRDRIGQALSVHHPVRHDERVMGLGYTLPWLDAFAASVERCLAMMPARQGAQIWPNAHCVASCLVMEKNLPLPECCLDRIILVHALEYAEEATEMLRELWRVLMPHGQIILVVANRHGLWSGAEHTPFGNGEPYSRGQLAHLLAQSGFMIESIGEIVHLWPGRARKFGRLSSLYERVTRLLFPYFGGVLIAHARRQSEPALVARSRVSPRFLVPALVPQASYPTQSSLKKDNPRPIKGLSAAK